MNIFRSRSNNVALYDYFNSIVPLTKRVALCYVSDIDTVNVNHTNRLECRKIALVLHKLGYVVDIFHATDRNPFRECHQYDLVIGFGESFRKIVRKNPLAKVILYLTEAHPHISLRNEQNRVDYYNSRHRFRFPRAKIERSETYYSEDDFNLSETYICLGEWHAEYLRELYPTKKVHALYPTPLISKFKKSNFETANDYLWFGSRGLIHKGLDLLIETFKLLPEKTLHVCGVGDETVNKFYKKVPKNVVLHGFVDVNSEKFDYLLQKCRLNILLSASEAVPTSVLTLMNCGLPSIVNSNCGTDFSESAFLVETYIINDLAREISEIMSVEDDILLQKAKAGMSRIEKYHTLINFEDSIEKLLRAEL